MLRLASDADVHGETVRGLRRRSPDIDIVRAQDFLGDGADDSEVLDWAIADERALITNDRSTMTALVSRRLKISRPVAGLIVTSGEQSIGGAIEDILLIAECMTLEEVRNDVFTFLPLRGRSAMS